MRLSYLQGTAPDAIYAWARSIVDDLNRAPSIEDLPVFADDTAAEAGNVKVGQGYATPSGIVRRRVA